MQVEDILSAQQMDSSMGSIVAFCGYGICVDVTVDAGIVVVTGAR